MFFDARSPSAFFQSANLHWRPRGAVVGTSTFPTGWSTATNDLGTITATIMGSGVEFGIDYFDVRFAGTGGATLPFYFIIPHATVIDFTAASGQTWEYNVYYRLVSGNLNGTALFVALRGRTAAGVETEATSAVIPTFLYPLHQFNVKFTRTLNTGTTARVSVDLTPIFPVSTAIDFTLRVGWFGLRRVG